MQSEKRHMILHDFRTADLRQIQISQQSIKMSEQIQPIYTQQSLIIKLSDSEVLYVEKDAVQGR
jgi:hypothetical protein